MRPKVVVVGCGVVGAMIAYELSAQVSMDICVIDQRQPAQGSTGAALGVLMGIISQKVKGRTWQLREASVRRYRSLIDELQQKGCSVPFNNQGIVSLCFDEGKLSRWQTLKEKRAAQGWPLEIWSPSELKERCPHIELESEFEDENGDRTSQPKIRSVAAAIYSPADAQVHPATLTRALVSTAKKQGVRFVFDTEVTGLEMNGSKCIGVQTVRGDFSADWVVLSAGLGSAALSQLSNQPLELMSVLGQAMEIRLKHGLQDDHTFQPVINGDDIQLVPLGENRYWLGATVEFPDGDMPLEAEVEGLKNLQQGAARFCSTIAQADILRTWSGLRPRPVGQPAPVIKLLDNMENVMLATGHYRNGVLLAPATAQQVCDRIRVATLNQ
ncbi:MAG: FAD-dependent oxidoreductase [Cyanobacteria bacterium P01_D01_bin.1]